MEKGRHRLQKVVGRTRMGRVFRALVAFAVGTGVVVSTFTVQSQPAAAAPQDIQHLNLATYNLQGGTAGRESKWTNGVEAVVFGDSHRNIPQHDVVAIQEAGPSARGDRIRAFHNGSMQVIETRWTPGHESRFLYFMETDPNGHRNNLAIVSRRPADGVIMIPGSASNSASRPAFGLLFNTTVIYNMHALSRSHGSDAPGMVERMREAAGNNSWVVLGDFNREPNTMENALRASASRPQIGHVESVGQATHRNGGELDYMVTSGDLTGVLTSTLLANPGGGDHWPVQFEPTLAATAHRFEVQAAAVPNGGSAMLEAEQHSSNPPSHTRIDDVVVAEPGHGASVWHTANYNASDSSAQIANDDPTFGCLTMTVLDHSMATEPCDPGSLNQRFTERNVTSSDGNDEVEIHNATYPNYCIQYSPGHGLDPRSVARWTNCDDQADTRWIVTDNRLKQRSLPQGPSGSAPGAKQGPAIGKGTSRAGDPTGPK